MEHQGLLGYQIASGRPARAAMIQSGNHPNPRTMVTNPWINRITVLVVMFAIYAAGYAGGRDAAVQAYNNHPACNTNLKP